jgi:hypothetical protein
VTRQPAGRRLPEAVGRLLDRTLAADEFQRLLALPLTDAEREDTRALVRWFTRRYPTPAERFAYIRRARARWLERAHPQGPASRPGHHTPGA